MFLDMTHWLPTSERVTLTRRIAMYSWLVMIVSLLFDSTVLNSFGISLPALRIAGGLAVADLASPGFGLSSLLIATVIAVTIYWTYAHAATVANWIGPEGTRAITRLSAFL